MNEALRMSEDLEVTEGIHRAVDIAREEARKYSSTQVDTEHLLLALLKQKRERKNFVGWWLGEFGVTLPQVREQIESLRELDRESGEEVEFAFTLRLRSVVEEARREARQLGDDYLGTEHLLLGLLGEAEGTAAQVLATLGVNQNQARRTVMRMLGVEE